MLKIRRSHDRLIVNMGIPIPGKDSLYIEMGPRCGFVSHVVNSRHGAGMLLPSVRTQWRHEIREVWRGKWRHRLDKTRAYTLKKERDVFVSTQITMYHCNDKFWNCALSSQFIFEKHAPIFCSSILIDQNHPKWYFGPVKVVFSAAVTAFYKVPKAKPSSSDPNIVQGWMSRLIFFCL